jgi:protein TonB
MEIKKSPKADLEKGKALGLLMGIVVGLAVLFVGFEWGARDLKISDNEGIADIIAEEEVEITKPEEVPPPPPPPPPQVVAEVLNIVEDNVDVAETDLLSTEDDQGQAQTQTYVPPAVTVEEEESSNEVFMIVEVMPEFPGGMSELAAYLSKSIKYPVVAQENGIHGRVTCSFTVNKDGSIVDAEIIRGIDAALDKEALRVVNAMPKWKPGQQRGKPVRVRYTLPINFRLQN